MGAAADVETYRDLAISAYAAGEYSAAIQYAATAKLIIATLPNASRNSPGGGSESLAWNPAGIDSFIADCRRSAVGAVHATAGPLQQVPVKYVREADDASYT